MNKNNSTPQILDLHFEATHGELKDGVRMDRATDSYLQFTKTNKGITHRIVAFQGEKGIDLVFNHNIKYNMTYERNGLTVTNALSEINQL